MKFIGTAKHRIITRIKSALAEIEMKTGVADQMNACAIRETLAWAETLNLVQAHKLEGAICAAEDSSRRGAEKYGWKWSPVSPMDYRSFAPSAVGAAD